MFVIAVLTVLAPFAFAQEASDYPSKTVRVIVGSGPGGGADQTARMMAQKLTENLKSHAFVVENRPGGGDTIATGLAAKAPADGYTLMVAAPSFTIAPSLFPKFPVDPVRDFAAISLSSKAPLLLVTHPSLPVKSVRELIALASSKPGVLDWAITPASNQHMASAYFASLAKIKVTFVPYKGGNQTVSAGVAGEVPILLINTFAVMPQVQAGRLRPLAVTTKERSSLLPEVPTIAESGVAVVAGYDLYSWYGWLAPAGTPAAILNKLSAELIRVVKSPDVAKRTNDAGAVVVGSTPEQFAQLIATEVARWRKVTKELDIRVE
jgi:tripartite-type tricarboxylate transporter receptor subunit TctC